MQSLLLERPTDSQAQTLPTPVCILVIDDDESFRLLVRTLLDHAGYDVIEASNGRDGLRLLAQLSVDVLITDIVTPEFDGIGIIMRARRLRPRLRILAISGVTALCQYLLLAARLGADATLEKARAPEPGCDGTGQLWRGDCPN